MTPGTNIYYNNHFSENIVNDLHDWIDKQPCVIPYPNRSDSTCVKANGDILKKHNHLLKISVCEMHNGIILPVYQGGFYAARKMYGRACVGDTSLRKYTPKHIIQ